MNVQDGYSANLYNLNKLLDSLDASRTLVTTWNISTAVWASAVVLLQPSHTPREIHLSLTLAPRETEQLGNQQGQAESYLQM